MSARLTMRRRPARVPERVVQAQVVHLLRSLGAVVWTLGTTRRRGDHPGTMQTEGLPDLLAFLKRVGGDGTRQLLVVEVKAAGGRLRPEQVAFRDLCQSSGIAHVVGGVDDVVAWLVQAAYLRADQVPYYRQPAGRQEGR